MAAIFGMVSCCSCHHLPCHGTACCSGSKVKPLVEARREWSKIMCDIFSEKAIRDDSPCQCHDVIPTAVLTDIVLHNLTQTSMINRDCA